MKKNTKILIFVLSLVLLIGAAMSVSAAEETPAPEIMAKNVIYGANIRFQFAVDATAYGEGKTVTVKVYGADPANGATPVDTITAEYTDVRDTNLGTDYAYIASSDVGISAIDFGREFWVVAECDGVAGSAFKYSVVEYFLERLYADADEITEVQKAHYENSIRYGSSAQKVTGDTKTNVADYRYILAKDGKVNGAEEGVMVLKGDALSFTYTGTDTEGVLKYWVDPTGNKTAVATASGTYAPKFATHTFNDLSNSTVITTSDFSGFKPATFADGDKDVSKYKNFLYNEIPSTEKTQSYNIVDGKLHYTSTGGTRWALNNTPNAASNANHTVFDTDLTVSLPESQISTSITTQFYATGVSQVLYSMIFRYYSDDVSSTPVNEAGKIECYFQRNLEYSSEIGTDTTHLWAQVAEAGSKSATMNIRFESYYISSTDDTTMVVSVNGEPLWILDSRGVDRTNAPTSKAQVDAYKNTDGVYVCQYAFTEASSNDFSPRNAVYKCIMFNPNTGYPTDMYFDNMLFESNVVAEENIPVYNLTRK